MKTTSIKWLAMRGFTIAGLLLATATVSACSETDETDNSGGSSEYISQDVDSEWKGWTLTGTAYTWPEEKRTAEEKTFTFATLPTSKKALKEEIGATEGLEQRITSPQHAVALCYATLCHYKKNPDAAKAMYRWLKGPEGITTLEWQNISRRLKEKPYITFAFFDGATPLNNYTPAVPYVCRPFTQTQGNDNGGTYIDYGTYTETDGVLYCKVFVRSGGADSPVPIMTKFHRASGNWFINGTAMVALTDIRQPASQGDGW